MGQIESKESETNDLSDRKEIIRQSKGSTSSNELNIKIDDNSDENKESKDESNSKETEKDKKLKKAKTYDFACTVFFAMVALLLFSTLSRTYTTYSGGGCGALYGAQPLLAYSCVGMACAIIKSLRKHIKEEIKQNSDEPDKEDDTEEETKETKDSTESKPYEVSTLTSKEKFNNELDHSNETELLPALSKKDALIVNLAVANSMADKLSTGLPLPQLPPPPKSLAKREVSFQSPYESSALSAVDLKYIETETQRIEFLKNKINETHGSDEPVVKTKSWKDIKFETELFRNRQNSHQPIDYNWNEYNLNSIDKY